MVFAHTTAQAEKEANDRRKSTFAYLIKPNGGKWFNKPMSLGELGQTDWDFQPPR